jgi:mono/diheme cytochrome c family protein
MTALPLDPGSDGGKVYAKYPGPMVRAVPATWVRALERVPPRGPDALVARGRSLFYQTDNQGIATWKEGCIRGGLACASCHIDGRDDGMTWQLERGPRQTPMLAGRLLGTAPYGWEGDRSTLQGHIVEAIHRFHGKGLDSGDLDALAAYVTSIPPPSFKALDRAAADRGARIFAVAGCVGCHIASDELFTDTERHDVHSGGRPNPSALFDTPSLLYVGGTAPYFHDGRYATLDELLDKTNGTMGATAQLSAQQRRDLVTYLESIGAQNR